MPFLSEDEYDLDDSIALKTDQAKRESARNVVQTLKNDLSVPKMYLQEIDPETGFPLRKTLISGGLEYFNDHGSEVPEASEYDIDAILSGDVSIDDAMERFDSGHARSSVSVTQTASQAAMPAEPLPAGVSQLGLDFIKSHSAMPDQQVQICFTGPASFQVPIFCHKMIVTEALIVLVTDRRAVPVSQEMDFRLERNGCEAALRGPDQSVYPIVPPVPRTVSFELGILRCTLFVRK